MYYILNERNKIIGLDSELEKYLQINGLTEFMIKEAKEEIRLEKDSRYVTIINNKNRVKFKVSEAEIRSIIGIFYLISIGDEAKLDKEHILDYLNLEETPRNIGLTEEQYLEFVYEFVDVLLDLKENLQSVNRAESRIALEKIKEISRLLRTEELAEEVENILNEKDDLKLRQFFNLVENSNKNIHKTNKEEPKFEINLEIEPIIEKVEAPIVKEEPKMDLNLEIEKEEPIIKIDLVEKPKKEDKSGVKTIDLSNIKQKHFDFQVNAASDDLGIPEDVIREFILEFVQQVEDETVKLIKAYEAGNLDTMQKIGHLLKGAASNLRIEPLAKPLFEIQFCEDINLMEPLVKEYWALFLSLKAQLDLK